MKRSNRIAAALALVLLGTAPAVVAAEPAREWEGRAGLAYVTSQDFRGGGVLGEVLRRWEHFAAGLAFDAIVAGASGDAPTFGGGEMPYRYSFLSMLVGGVAQLRAKGLYAEAILGIAGTQTIADENTQCSYGTGLAGGLGGGIAVDLNPRMAVGARAAARLIAGSTGCTDVGGPKSFDTIVLYSLGATFDLRW